MALIRKDKSTDLIQADRRVVREAMNSRKGAVLEVSLEDGKAMKTVVKQIDRDSISRRVEHLVLQEVLDDDRIKISIPLRIEGTPDAVAKNVSTLTIQANMFEAMVIVKHLPEAITVDVSGLEENDVVVLGDVELGEGIEPISGPDTVIASTRPTRASVAAEDAAGEEGEEGAEGEEGEGEESEGSDD